MNRDQWNQCGSKVRYRTEEEAMRMRAGARRKGYRNAETLRVYPCRFCGGFHLTHQNRKRGD